MKRVVIAPLKFRTYKGLLTILNNRTISLNYKNKFSEIAQQELCLLSDNEFNSLSNFRQSLDLQQEEISHFLLSPKTPEMAKVLGLPVGSDQLNQIVNWENRFKNRINTPAIENTWNYAIPALAGLVAMAGSYTFSQEKDSALGIGFVTTLAVGFLKDFINTQRTEALEESKPKKEILPQIYFFLKDPHITNIEKQKIRENLKNMNPIEMTLLEDLTTSEIKEFFMGGYKEQQKVLNQHKFSHNKWQEMTQSILSFILLSDKKKQEYINKVTNNRNLINNILTRRMEGLAFSKGNKPNI